MRGRLLTRLTGWLLLLGGCGSGGLATVPTGEHRGATGRLVVVDYPPPPARVEQVGPAPRPECEWVDGYWDWVGRSWEWIHGGWVEPVPGCYYAPRIIMVWVASQGGGTLYYGKPRWYPEREGEQKSCPDPDPCAPVAPEAGPR